MALLGRTCRRDTPKLEGLWGQAGEQTGCPGCSGSDASRVQLHYIWQDTAQGKCHTHVLLACRRIQCSADEVCKAAE